MGGSNPAAEDPTALRVTIKVALNEIAAEVADALRRAQLGFPVYLTVPNSGDSLATVACPLDPSDEDWSQASEIVCRIVGKRLGGGRRLRGRELVCTIANPTMAVTEVSIERTETANIARPRCGRRLILSPIRGPGASRPPVRAVVPKGG
jgi:hypothetical protein